MEGSYEILGVIGRSGLGTLYSARFVGEGGFSKLVALKMLDEGVTESDEIACRLRDEARVLGFLKHPCIVQADRLIRLAGRWTLAQEHVEGVALEAILARGPMPDGPALEVVAGVAGALHAAYTSPGPDGASLRLQHRDIKPATILVDAYGAPHVIDFGIARAFFSGRESHTRSFVVGSFEFMAPERLALEEGGPWSDIYSLGQVLFALLMGHGFGRSHPSESHHKAILDRVMEQLLARPGGVDEELLDLLGRMISLEPHERPEARSVERACHEITRRLGQETLRSWAERVVEPLLAQRSTAQRGGLVGRRLSEGEAAVPRPLGPPLTDPGIVVPRPVAQSSTPEDPPHVQPALRPGLRPVAVVPQAGEDDATEIMSLSPGGGLDRGLPGQAEFEATEALNDPGGASPLAPEEAAPPNELPEPPAPEGRPTQVSEEFVEPPTTISPWESLDLGESLAEGALDEVTAVTDFASLDPGTMDREAPTAEQQRGAEPTEALGEERPSGEVARFDPSRVLPVSVEVEPAPAPGLPLFDEATAVEMPPEPPPAPEAPASLFDEATAAKKPPEPPALPPPPAPPEPAGLAGDDAVERAADLDPESLTSPDDPSRSDLPIYGKPKHWTPPQRKAETTRPQPDVWVPPSAETLSGRHPRPELPTGAPLPEQDDTYIPPSPSPESAPDETVPSTLVPAWTLAQPPPGETAPEGIPTDVEEEPTPAPPESVSAEPPALGVAPPPRPSAALARKKRPPILLIALALLLVGGLLLVVFAAATAGAWFLLGG